MLGNEENNQQEFFPKLEYEEAACLPRKLSEEELKRLEQQNSRLVPEYRARLLEKNAQKHWDLFYKRNETRFFKDRHWCLREFPELLINSSNETRTLLEVGCGVGNFVFPLMEECLDFRFIACDLSGKAIEILQKNELYDGNNIKAFQTDVTTDDILSKVEENSVNIITLIFVVSAIHPGKFLDTFKRLYKLLKPGGIILFRDYGLHDMAQLRFKASHKIDDNFYMRQDGTRVYYFSTEFLSKLFSEAGFTVVSNTYIRRRTVNVKEKIDVERIFVQAKAMKTE